MSNPLSWLSALDRLASSMDRLSGSLERWLDDQKIPPVQDPREVERLAAEPAVGEQKEEWELAVEEEIQKRREAADREEKL